jgi:hypothetical protein
MSTGYGINARSRCERVVCLFVEGWTSRYWMKLNHAAKKASARVGESWQNRQPSVAAQSTQKALGRLPACINQLANGRIIAGSRALHTHNGRWR